MCVLRSGGSVTPPPHSLNEHSILDPSGGPGDSLDRQLELRSLRIPDVERHRPCPIPIHCERVRARIPADLSVRDGTQPTVQSRHGPSGRDRPRGRDAQSLVSQGSADPNLLKAVPKLYFFDHLCQLLASVAADCWDGYVCGPAVGRRVRSASGGSQVAQTTRVPRNCRQFRRFSINYENTGRLAPRTRRRCGCRWRDGKLSPSIRMRLSVCHTAL